MTDKELSIEYSLDTPNFFNENILNKKILDLVKKNNMIGGGFNLDFMSIILLLIGLILIIVGFVLLWIKNDLVEAEAKAVIVNKQCMNKNKDMEVDAECKINIKYTVDNIQYSKIIAITKSEFDNLINANSSKIKIYYSKSEPNLVSIQDLNNWHNSIIGIGLIFIGIYIIIISSYDSNIEKKDLSNI